MFEFGFLTLVLALLALWMAIKVWPDSPVMAFLTFVFWPIGVIALIRNWGNPGNDIRIPFALAVIVTGLIMYQTQSARDRLVATLDPDFIEDLRDEDPEAAAWLEAEQRRLRGDSEPEAEPEPEPSEAPAMARRTPALSDLQDIDAPTSPRLPDPTPEAEVPPEAAAEASVAPGPRLRMVPVDQIRLRRGRIRLATIFATLELPPQYRYAPVGELGGLAAQLGIEVDDKTLGWIVHERVDLEGPRAWWVELRFYPIGYRQPESEAQRDTDPYAWSWDPRTRIATFSLPHETSAVAGEQAFAAAASAGTASHDHYAVLPLRHGLIELRTPRLPASRRELGLRATRLVASRLRADSGWEDTAFSGDPTAPALRDWPRARATATIEVQQAQARDEEARRPRR